MFPHFVNLSLRILIPVGSVGSYLMCEGPLPLFSAKPHARLVDDPKMAKTGRVATGYGE